MTEPDQDDLLPEIRAILKPGEDLAVAARALDAVVAATSQRLVVKVNRRVALEVEYGELRRIQFDIERQRPATLVIVPESPAREAQVLSIPVQEIPRIAAALAFVSQRLAEAS